jgi:pimeloyl-ACP methyl ester carboxylesterase
MNLAASPRAHLTSVRLATTALLAVAALSAGCTTIGDVIGFKKQVEEARAVVRINGRLDTEGASNGTLVVILGKLVPDEENPGQEKLVGQDAYSLDSPGSFLFLISSGRYQVGAYEDRNGDGMVGPDERVSRVRDSPVYDLQPGESARAEITLRNGSELGDELAEPLDILAIIERTPKEQRDFALWAFSQKGTVVDSLEDERFGPEAGPKGLWKPMDFLHEELAGIYMLEPYDPDRIPVLFVHGISGYPQEFDTLIDELDRERFQPWFYFYPSGFSLIGISNHFARLLEQLRVTHRFDELAIVAHSMGGLVSRGAILQYAGDRGHDQIRLFISISTPWGGDVTAERTEGAPIELPASFHDMDPRSDYMTWVFYQDDERRVVKRLPPRVRYHMMFGYGGSGGKCNDGTVSCASQAFWVNQQQALSVRALDYQHVPILHSPEVVERVNRLLDERF